VGLARALARAVAAIAHAVLVGLRAPFAPPLGIGLVGIEEGEQPTEHGQRGQEGQLPAAGAGVGQGAGKRGESIDPP
jgi:hypothetical protein